MAPIRFGNPDELQVRPGEFGADLLGPSGASAPAAPAPSPMMMAQEGGVPMRSEPRPLAAPPAAGAAAGAPAQGEWPDWMTDDDKAFASMAQKAAQSYNSRVQKRRQDRAAIRDYQKLMKERDTARGQMEDLAGIMKETPALFFEEDGQTPNAHGLAIIRQLSKHRQRYKRAKDAEKKYLEGLQKSGMKVPQKDELTDDDLLALQQGDDEEFDRQVGDGYANSLAYMGNQ